MLGKHVLLLGLFASLAGNAALLFFYYPLNPSRTSRASAAENSLKVRGSPAQPDASIDEGLKAPTKNPLLTNPKAIADKMRADGYPNHVIYQAVSIAIKLKHRAEKMAITGMDRPQRWRGPLKLSPEAASKLKKIEEEEDRELRELTDISTFLSEQNAENEVRRYGHLAPEKISILKRIESDYAAITSKYRQSGEETAEKTLAARWKIKGEMESDVLGLLSPDEAKDYFRYNSEAAKMVQRQLAGLDIDDRQYERLADAAINAEASAKQLFQQPELFAQNTTQLFKVYRESLGDENFALVIPQIDPLAGTADSFFQKIQVAPSIRADLFFAARLITPQFANGGGSIDTAKAVKVYGELVYKAGLTPTQTKEFERTALGAMLVREIRRTK